MTPSITMNPKNHHSYFQPPTLQSFIYLSVKHRVPCIGIWKFQSFLKNKLSISKFRLKHCRVRSYEKSIQPLLFRGHVLIFMALINSSIICKMCLKMQ